MKPFPYGSSTSLLAWGFPCFLLPIILVSFRCPPICPVGRMAASFCAVSSSLYFCSPGDFLPLGIRFKICFGFLLLITLTICQAHCALSTNVYVAKSFSLYRLCSDSCCHILQIPLSCAGPNILWMILLSKEPTIFATVWESVHMLILHKK
jgi:hypothetical protein